MNCCGGGFAAFPATAMIEDEVRHQFGVERVGWIRGVRETYYAIAVQRRVMHPVVQRLFAQATRALRGSEKTLAADAPLPRLKKRT